MASLMPSRTRRSCTVKRNWLNASMPASASVAGGMTYRQAEAAGGHVRRGEKGTVVCYADRFTPKGEAEKAGSDDREARTIAFLKRFTVFNVDQCEGLPDELTAIPVLPDPVLAIEEADRVIGDSGADVRIGGGEAFYAPGLDYVQVPPQAAFHTPIDWYRTALHELGHNAASRIMPNCMPRSAEFAGFSSRAFGIILQLLPARPARPLRCHAFTACGKLPDFSALKFEHVGFACQGRKLMRDRRACSAKTMPHGGLRKPSVPASLRHSHGIIWDAALCPLCRYRHNGHWVGHSTRLGRDQSGAFGSAAYAKEELVAEISSAFTCAALGIVPTVRHSDYIGSCLAVRRADEKAIFRAASQASKAADYLLSAGEHRS